MSARPWKAIRTPFPDTAMPYRPGPPVIEHGGYDVDLSELERISYEEKEEDEPPHVVDAAILADAEKKARFALEMSEHRESFAKSEIDAVISEAEARGIAFTKSRAYVVTFDGQNFTLSKNVLSTRLFFQLDAWVRRMGGG